MISARTPTPLRDVLHAFSLAKPVPDADLLEQFVRRYPEHATALTEFAIEAAVDAMRGDTDGDADDVNETISPAVSRAMSAFQNRLFSVRTVDTTSPKVSPAVRPEASNPFASLDRANFRALATRLNANSVFVAKLRDRQIDPDTMTAGFRQRVSAELDVSLAILDAHFAAEPLLGEQAYKADQKPRVGPKQSFEDAVRGSGLSETQQRELLKL